LAAEHGHRVRNVGITQVEDELTAVCPGCLGKDERDESAGCLGGNSATDADLDAALVACL
jgi:hypothetical protein